MSKAVPTSSDLPLTAATLEALSARFRPCGVCVAAWAADGSLAYADRTGSAFFDEYAVPVLRTGALPGGVVVESLPWQKSGATLGLIASGGAAAVGDTLPTSSAGALRHQVRLLHAAAADAERTATLQGEVDSLSGQLANTYEELSLIYHLSSGMKLGRTAADFFKEACLDVADVMGVRGVGVALRGDGLATGPALYGELSLPRETLARLTAQFFDQLNLDTRAVMVNDVATHVGYAWLGNAAARLLVVPLQRQDEVLGCLFAVDKTRGEFTTVDAKLLTSIANESAIYLQNALLFEDVRGLMMGTLHSLTSAVDAKDPYTCGHSERVALLTRELAKEAGLSDTLVERVYIAALLHDVGKIGVPEAVLQKPGRLTDEEFTQMKAHPEIGAKILRDVKQLVDIVPGVLHHHERFDGRGYPQGLAGSDIPLMGRLICLCDSFDAMTSNRTYRKALPWEVAIGEIEKGAGTHFDPKLVEAFLRIGETRIRELLAGQEPELFCVIEPRPGRLSA